MSIKRIYAAAFGYDLEKVSVFINSAVRFVDRSEIALFVEPASPLRALTAQGVTVVVCDDSLLQTLSPTARRYFFFQEHLARATAIEAAMISDVRDVLFQSNPFEYFLFDNFDFLYPLEERSIGMCQANRRWIVERYGAGVFRDLMGCIISCCGTVIGRRAAMTEYLEKMCDHLRDAPNTFGIDQGVHNFIVNRSPVKRQAAVVNALYNFITLHYMEPSAIKFNEDGYILNYDHSVPSVVHQYDRLPEDVVRRFAYLERLKGPLQLGG
jgi:hypothetical protein